MPIRINLLAEQQAADEARRRDPVKRGLWIGSGLVVLMVLWIVSLQFRLVRSSNELNRYESSLRAVEENSKEIRQDWATASQLENRIANLHRYTTNRFFSAVVLDAMQQIVLDDVRLVQLQTSHAYSTNAESTFRTNLVFPIASRAAWKFWSSQAPQTNIMTLVSNQVASITNKLDAFKTPVDLVTKIAITTNGSQATANIEITKPTTAAEQVLLTIKARDYGAPAGRHVDEFSKAVATHPYFAKRLLVGEGQGLRLRERGIQPQTDLSDPLGTTRPFVPFIIECRYRETLRAND